MQQRRQLAAILFTDIVGYTAMMQRNETLAVTTIKRYKTVLREVVAAHSGKILNDYGDGNLCIFSSVIEATQCALKIQEQLQTEPSVPLRIGLHIGEIFFEEKKVLGDGVNVASRIQSLGYENTILLSREIFDKIKNHPEFKSVSLGLFDFKNVDESMEVFALTNEGLNIPKREQMKGKLKKDLLPKKNTDRRNLIAALIILFLLAAIVLIYVKYFKIQKTDVDKSIAVLPFINMSDDPQQEYFAEGMMDEVLNNLYKIGGLNVISRTSSMTYKDSKKTSKEIASELGVGNLLEGSVQKEGTQIKIIVRLINGKTEDNLWDDTYEREFKDVFAIQSEIAQQIAVALKIKIDPVTKNRIEHVPTTNTSAYNVYLKAKEKALNPGWKELLENVIQLDTSFAPAYADLGFYWLLEGGYSGHLNAKQVLDSALPFLQKAVQLDSNLASVHNYLAQAHLWYEWDFNAAGREWKKFFQLNPSGVVWGDNYSDFLQSSGRFGEALDFTLSNYEKDKKNWGYLTDVARDYYYLNEPNKAQAIFDSLSTILKDPSLFWNKAWLSIWLGKYQQAMVNLNKYVEAFPDDHTTRLRAWFAISYFHTGMPSETQKILDTLQVKSKKSPVGSPSFHIAMIYCSTGRVELALQWLEKAYMNHEVEMYWLNVEPIFKSLHNNSQFRELLTKIGFK